MKKLSLLSAILGLGFMGVASAADVTIYYSPSCPHCHHARDFATNTLIYEYPELKITMVDVTNPQNTPLFQEALKKCGSNDNSDFRYDEYNERFETMFIQMVGK